MKRQIEYLVVGEVLIWLGMLTALFTAGFSIICVLMFALIQILYLCIVSRWVLRPLLAVEKTMDELLQEESTEEQLAKAAGEVIFMDKVEELVDLYAERRTRNNSAQIFNKQTELTALQSQINPHFLYNTLDSIRAQALLDDNIEISRMVEALASFFRYSISGKDNLVTLRDELANINNYMMIQRYRFNNRFSLEINIDEEDEEAYDYLVPRLMIQPIVENAIFHGLEEQLEEGKVVIEVIVSDKYLMLIISDNGKGMDPKELKELNERIRSKDKHLDDRKGRGTSHTGIALPNVHKRIQLLFGEECGLNVYSTQGEGTDVEVTVLIQKARSGEQ